MPKAGQSSQKTKHPNYSKQAPELVFGGQLPASYDLKHGPSHLASLYQVYLYKRVMFLATDTDRMLVGERVVAIERQLASDGSKLPC